MDDCHVKSFRIQTNPDLVGCCEQDHTADPVGWYCAFLPDSFSFEVIQFDRDAIGTHHAECSTDLLLGSVTMVVSFFENIFVVAHNLISGR